MDYLVDESPRTKGRGPDRSGPEFDELRRAPVFSGVEEGLVEGLLEQCSTHHFRVGATIVEQDRQLDSFRMISRGLVDLTRIQGQREFGIFLLAAHDLLLPAAALFKERCLVSARALTRTKICTIPVPAIVAAMRQSPQFAVNIMAVTSGQWRMSVRNLLDLSSRTAAQRVGVFLLRIADLQAESAAQVLPIPKRHLAARLGITAETLSRMLQTVAKNGLYLRGRTIIVRDRAKIEAFCGPDPYVERDERELGVFVL